MYYLKKRASRSEEEEKKNMPELMILMVYGINCSVLEILMGPDQEGR